MYPYSISQWVLFFVWYCLVGWIWESFYVSICQAIKNKRWEFINRGFLHGPFLPIYGSAATVILLATIPVKTQWWMVYLFGALAATLLELVTGTAMEKMFKVKYWDYSDLPLNFKGHICFFVSLFWGLCALFMTEIIHVPIERVVFLLPKWLTEILAVTAVGYFAYDFTLSFREAMDMREILERLTENNESLQRLERRFDAVVAFTPVPDIEDIKEKGRTVKERVLNRVEKSRDNSLRKIRQMRDYLMSGEALSLPDREELLQQLEHLLKNTFSRTGKQYLGVVKHLKRNPGVISKKYQKALEEIKELFER